MTEANAEATLQPEARQRRWKVPDLLPAKREKGDARIAAIRKIHRSLVNHPAVCERR
jgi:hypothetical protein